MKIFMDKEFASSSTLIRMVNDDGTHILLRGEECGDFMPAFGCELRAESSRRLLEWMIKNQGMINCELPSAE